jgi:anti-sigma-K factor RskA
VAGHEEKYLEYAAVYALGALDGSELQEFEAHLKSGCPICATEVASMMETSSKLPAALPQLVPSKELRQRVLDAVHSSVRVKSHVDARTQEIIDRGVRQPAHRSWLTWGLTFAVIVMIVVFSMSYNSLLNTLNEKNETITTQRTQITALTDELQRKTEILKVLESRRIDIVTMDGLKVNPVGYGKIIWDPDKKVAILQVSNLPKVPKDKDYQLWVIKQKDPKPISVGIFAVENEGETENYFKVQPLEVADKNEIGAFAITLEPKGGVPQPTGEMYLLGKAAAN